MAEQQQDYDGGTAGSNAYGTWVVNEVGCLTFKVITYQAIVATYVVTQ